MDYDNSRLLPPGTRLVVIDGEPEPVLTAALWAESGTRNLTGE